MTARITLLVVEGSLRGQKHVFTERTSCVVGRARDCSPQLPSNEEHCQISRHHCLLDINPPDIRIRDFGSLNGTFVNGRKIGQRQRHQSPEEGAALGFPEYDLKPGDRITLGKTVMEVAIHVPAICCSCAAQIPDDERPLAQVGPEEFLCGACRRRERAGAAARRGRQCARCGRDVALEAGPRRSGAYVCLACRADPLAIMERLLDLAATGRQELAPIRGYRIQRELGRGGMGAVFLAQQQATGREVALKLMVPQVAADQRAVQNFLREAENTLALRHPHVVRAYEVGCCEGTFFFTLELCRGGSLSDLVEHRGGRLSLEEALSLSLQVLDGLSYAHQAPIPNVRLKGEGHAAGRGLVHRDLKPQNVLLTDDDGAWLAKVADFGLSKAFDQAGLSGQTRTGDRMGTPVFMAREQVRRFNYARPDVDVWAAAATLYYLLTGHFVREFRQDPRRDLWLQVLECDAVPIRQRNPAIPARLAAVIDQALREEPRIGFASAAEFKRALEAAL